MELVTAVVAALRANAELVATLPAGVRGIGHMQVPAGTERPYVLVHGGDGGEPSYGFGNVERLSDEYLAIEVVTVMTAEESADEVYLRVIGLVRAALIGSVTMPGKNVLNLRRKGGIMPQRLTPTQGEPEFRSGDRYEVVYSA